MICAGLLGLFSNSWIPVAIYMSLTMVVSFIATRLTPETLNRDLTDPEDARHHSEIVTAAAAGPANATTAQHVK